MSARKLAEEIIKEFEGFYPNAYPDPLHGWSVPTIGYGTTNYLSVELSQWFKRIPVRQGDTITKEQAEIELRERIKYYERELLKRLTVTLKDHELAALISFAYNVGIGGAGKQIARLNAGLNALFANKLLEYVNKGSNVEAGLRRRREAERKLFLGQDLPKEAAPVKVSWLNIVRHEIEQRPEYRLYAMNAGDCVAWHKFETREELLKLLQRYPTAGNVSVGHLNWHMDPVKSAPDVVPYLKLVRTGKKESGGCEELLLTLEGTEHQWIVRSGQPWAQVFQHGGPENRPGSMMPLPGGEWTVGPIEFAGGKDNWSTEWAPGLGACWIAVEPKFGTRRGSIGFHVDKGHYGTAGCIGFRNNEEMKTFVSALREHDPKVLKVDW